MSEKDREGSPAGDGRADRQAQLEHIIRHDLGFDDPAILLRDLPPILSAICCVHVDGAAAGTGFLVADTFVLTCHHVVARAIEDRRWERVTLCFDHASIAQRTVNVKLARDPLVASSPHSPLDVTAREERLGAEPTVATLDFALLRLAHPPPSVTGAPPRQPLRLDLWDSTPAAFEPRSKVVILQHPLGAPVRMATNTAGLVSCNPARTRIRYQTNTEVGSSGSPCFDRDLRLIALHHAGEVARRGVGDNQGIPIETIWKNLPAEVREELTALWSAPPWLDERVRAVAERVEKLLSANADLAAALASGLGCSVECACERLLHAPAQEAAGAIEGAMATVAAADPSGPDSRAALELLRLVLPYAVNWREALRRHAPVGGASPDVIELPFRSATVAEAVAAGLHRRDCRFELDVGGVPVGVAAVGYPAVKDVPVMQRGGDTVLEAVVGHLSRQLGNVGASALDLQEKAMEVDAELARRRARAGAPVYYFLFIDKAVDREQAPAVWQVVRDRLRNLSTGLPNLALVRMTGERLTREEAALQTAVRALMGDAAPTRKDS